MNVIIDNLVFAWQKSGGISVVWYEIIKRLLKCNSLTHKISFINTKGVKDNIFYQRLHVPTELIIDTQKRIGFNIKRYIPISIKCKEPFIFHSTYYRVCMNHHAINIITVHDFTYERYSKGLRKAIHCFTKKYAINKADYIICISENTKKDLLKYNPNINKDRILVIYNGASDDFFVIKNELSRYTKNGEQFLVFVGNRVHYKNFELACKVAAEAKIKLKIVGSKLTNEEQINTQQILGDNYEELGYITNDELNELYNAAFALIYPSSYEGFGLPIVEAQKSGCPVLALKNSSIEEIIGDKEQLIDSPSINHFIRQINKLKDNTYRQQIIKKGIKNAETYSWEKTFQKYLDLYNEIERKFEFRA